MHELRAVQGEEVILKKLRERLGIGCEAYNIEDTLATLNTVESSTQSERGVMYRFSYDGTADHAAVNGALSDIFGPPILMQEDTEDKTYYNEYTDAESYVRVYFNDAKDMHLQLRGVTTNELTVAKIRKISIIIDTKKASNNVFALMSSPGGLGLRSLGKIDHDLIEANYTKDAVTGYNHITDCLSSQDPCGRLILLQGPPGTGKSYMIRSLVTSVNSTFIIVGAHMIAELSGPSILPVILGCVDPDDPKPVTFILEDSDIALSHRKNGGVAELSGLLNLGDGLLGEMLDIRIIATTNAELLDLDPAVTRPGRMCQHIHLRPFTPKEANELYASMVKNKTVDLRKNTTLAEIYRIAREDGWVPQTEDKPKAGQYI
jgi:hypothetical protein